MKNKCIAIIGKECYNSLKFLSDEFYLKLLNSQERRRIFEDFSNIGGEATYNPFGEYPPYWILIHLQKFDSNTSFDQKVIYKKLIKLEDFINLPTNITYDEFFELFLEKESYIRTQSDYINQIVINPEPMININSLKTEPWIDYIKRCRNEYKSKFIYEITLMISSTLKMEFEFRELESKNKLRNDPNLPAIRIWKETSYVVDSKYIFPLKNLVISICSRLEANNIFNYSLSINTEDMDMYLEMQRDNTESWKNYDPHKFGF